ncbi:hypothetical protein H181DRAFT_01134 [Streptomyces sp. WMMB 714]|uniref:hypothetical protein n=1 Tax=Streptomyces sp. WMMB 714 TaxID=1286822 RepID=UPI0005F7A26B|nr:hypothetical protein [Streptomyces sp. WMMB 714]SCK17130.1 hypothetical protein H181DRAFT_01134 [Streptomyces sp. WMMB 714]
MPAPAATPLPPRLLARSAAALCVLAAAAAVLSFAKGSGWMGAVWVLLAGLASNMAWYYGRRARGARTAASPDADAAAGTGGCGDASRAARPTVAE